MPIIACCDECGGFAVLALAKTGLQYICYKCAAKLYYSGNIKASAQELVRIIKDVSKEC